MEGAMNTAKHFDHINPYTKLQTRFLDDHTASGAGWINPGGDWYGDLQSEIIGGY